MILRIKTEPVMAGADAKVYTIWYLTHMSGPETRHIPLHLL